MNTVSVIGRLTKDPEKKNRAGDTLHTFTLAVNHGKGADNASFFNVQCWGQRFEKVLAYTGKGKQIALQGSLKQHRWVGKDGANQSLVGITAQQITLIDQGEPQAKNQAETEDIPF